ncbi:MAG: HAD family hydrolase [Vulcanimicrobiaceae bacterium]
MIRDLGAVVFDLDDTLHNDTHAYQSAACDVAEEIGKAHNVSAQTIFDSYIEHTSRYWRALSAEHLNTPIADSRYELWAAALRSVGIDDDATTQAAARRYGERRRSYYTPFPGTLELLDALHERGLKLGLITNGFAETHYEKLELLGLGASFDAVICADEVGMVKPDPKIFLHACELLATPPSRSVMVGDRYFRDIVGARSAGLFTVYIDVHSEPIPPNEAPDVRVKGIQEVLKVLLP